MKVSRAWLQTYFDAALPSGEALADAFTFHSFEVEEQEDDLLDLKVLPDRAGYALSHRGIASELSAALAIPMKQDPLRTLLADFPHTDILSVTIEDAEAAPRYLGAVVEGVTVGPSPDWLRRALESVGQHSINNIVDATNYVMLNIGQPLHAFDAGKLAKKHGAYAIGVRSARKGEAITTLTGDTYTLLSGQIVITDASLDVPIAIAGIKGGKTTEVDTNTASIIVEAANFDGTRVRRTSQALKLVTDASLRFQNRPSPELAAYGMRDVLALITDIAGGEIRSVTDMYPGREQVKKVPVEVTRGRINGLLGSAYTIAEIEDVFCRLALPYTRSEETFTVTPPFERTDITIPEDLCEEVGRIAGYERIEPTLLPPQKEEPDQARFRGIERMKDELVAQGFVEVSTQSFAKKGDVELANPLDKTRPALRTSLEQTLSDALIEARRYAPLHLPPHETPVLFEIGTVFPATGEYLELRMTEGVPQSGDPPPKVDNLSKAKLEEYGKDYEPKRYSLSEYRPFSLYPFVLRDISMWIHDSDTARGAVLRIFAEEGAGLLAQAQLLDQFTNKEGRQSLAFRLVFQSMERTLTDGEVNAVMGRIEKAVAAKGYEVR